MKYTVMECHEGYAVLMDEEARFVTSANLHYEVGQSVTDPIILNEEQTARKITFTPGKFIAAAACLVLFASAGSMYYSHNLKTHSTVVISSDANIRMEVNKKGKVIHIVSDSESGKELLKNYSAKGKDKLTVANEIIGLEMEKGYISGGDTVDLYVSADDPKGYATFGADIERSNSEINVSVHGVAKAEKPAKPKDDAKKPDPPKPDKDNTPKAPSPEKDKDKDKDKEMEQQPAHTSAAVPAPETTDAKKPEPPKAGGKDDPPAPPADAEPKAPKEPKKHDENVHEDSKKPDVPHEPPKPPHHDEGGKNRDISAEIEISGQISLGEKRPTALLHENADKDAAPDKTEHTAKATPSAVAEHDALQSESIE